MRGSIGNAWLAFWTTSTNWPSSKEIDNEKAVNKQPRNKMTLHSHPGPYGPTINSASGAIYALEWTSDGMSVWAWSGGGAPSDTIGNPPIPSAGATPSPGPRPPPATSAPSSAASRPATPGLQIPVCSGLAATCEEYAQNNPTAFKDSYRTINAPEGVYKRRRIKF
ncbi:MAG: hypothetical protein Q9184_007735 [Pyrenodesmia sp. 2 TL-2023]